MFYNLLLCIEREGKAKRRAMGERELLIVIKYPQRALCRFV
jgi:hypothetical protein